MGRTLSRDVTLPIVGVGIASVKMANDFSQSLTRMIGLAGVSQKQVNSWSTDLMKLGPQVAKSPRELADALYEIASSGISTGKAMDVLTVSAKASTAGLGETRTVADAVTSVMNAYGENNISAAHATDVLIATVREGKGEADAFAPVIGNVAAIAAQMGVKFNDVGAALAGMTRLGTNARTSAVQLTSVFSTLLMGSKKTEDGLKKVGLSTAGLRQELKDKGLLPTLQTLKEAFHGNTAEMAKAFPNIRALRGVLALTGKSADATAQIFKRMGDTTGALATAFDAARKKSGFKFDQLKASAEVAGISLGMTLTPALNLVVGWLSKVATAYQNLDPHTKNFITMGLAVAAALGPVLIIVGHLAGAIGALAPIVAAVLSPIGLLVAAVALVVGSIAAAVLAPKQFAAALERVGVSAEHAKQIVSTLQGVFATLKTMFENATAGLSDIWATWGGTIKAVAGVAFDYIIGTIRNAFQVIHGIFQVIHGLLTGDWSELWKGLQNIFSGVVSQILNALKTWASAVQILFGVLWKGVQAVTAAAWNGIKSLLSSIWNSLAGLAKSAFSTVVSAISGAVGRAAAAAKAVGVGIVNGIKSGLAAIVAVVKGGLDKIWGVISSVASSAFNAAMAIGSQIMHGIAAGIESAVGAAIGAIEHAGGAILGAAKGVLHIGSPSKLMADEVGKPIMEGIAAGIIASEGLATGATARVLQKIKATFQAAQIVNDMKAAGEVIGTGFANSIIGGLIQRQPSLVQQANGLKAAIVASGPAIQEAGKVLGLSTAQAIAAGVLGYQEPMKAQIKKALVDATTAAIAASKQAVVDAKAAFSTAFGDLANAALAAFDKKMADWKPPSGTLLDAYKLQDQITQMTAGLGPAVTTAQSRLAAAFSSGNKQAIDQAQNDLDAALTNSFNAIDFNTTNMLNAAQATLAQAQAEGDPDKVAAAQAAYDQALTDRTAALNQNQIDQRALIEQNLQYRADAEQRTHDAIAAKQREGLAQQLYELQQWLLKHPAEWAKMGAKVQAVLTKYNVTLQAAGHAWADKFASGVTAGIPAAVKAAHALAAAVAAVLPSKNSPLSPAKTGPLAFHPYEMGKEWASNLGLGLAAGGLTTTMGTMASMPSGPAAAGAAMPGGGLVVNVYNAGSVVTENELVESVYRGLVRKSARNAGNLGLT
jgi:TP901 family phage tail tape measure protein